MLKFLEFLHCKEYSLYLAGNKAQVYTVDMVLHTNGGTDIYNKFPALNVLVFLRSSIMLLFYFWIRAKGVPLYFTLTLVKIILFEIPKNLIVNLSNVYINNIQSLWI